MDSEYVEIQLEVRLSHSRQRETVATSRTEWEAMTSGEREKMCLDLAQAYRDEQASCHFEVLHGDTV